MAGGSAQNTLRILQRLIGFAGDWQCYMVGKIGADDVLGGILKSLLEKDGVVTRSASFLCFSYNVVYLELGVHLRPINFRNVFIKIFKNLTSSAQLRYYLMLYYLRLSLFYFYCFI